MGGTDSGSSSDTIIPYQYGGTGHEDADTVKFMSKGGVSSLNGGDTNAKRDRDSGHNKEDTNAESNRDSFASGCLNHLEVDEEESNVLFYMVNPSTAELEMPSKSNKGIVAEPDMPVKSNKIILTPSLGNPDSYSAYECPSFDELKRLIKGHFEGYGHCKEYGVLYDVFHLVNRRFLAACGKYGYKVFHFFSSVRIKHDDLEKQNATLCSSLKQTQEDIIPGEPIFHDAREDLPGEPIFHDAREDLLPGDQHYFDSFHSNRNEMISFIGQNNDLDGFDEDVTPASSDGDDKGGNVDAGVLVDDWKRGGPKDVELDSRGDHVFPCHLKTWIRCGVLGIQPIHTLVMRCGTRKKLTKWRGQIDWIKHYLEDLEGVASMIQAFTADIHGATLAYLGLQSRLIMMQGLDGGGSTKKLPLDTSEERWFCERGEMPSSGQTGTGNTHEKRGERMTDNLFHQFALPVMET
jgi:hypothetical protein